MRVDTSLSEGDERPALLSLLLQAADGETDANDELTTIVASWQTWFVTDDRVQEGVGRQGSTSVGNYQTIGG